MHASTQPTNRSAADLDGVLRLSPSSVVRELVELLGARMVALLGGVDDTRYVRKWEAGESSPQRIENLRAALQATRAIVETGGPATAHAWFLGCNSRFDFTSPVEILDRNVSEARRDVVRAAVHFAYQ